MKKSSIIIDKELSNEQFNKFLVLIERLWYIDFLTFHSRQIVGCEESNLLIEDSLNSTENRKAKWEGEKVKICQSLIQITTKIKWHQKPPLFQQYLLIFRETWNRNRTTLHIHTNEGNFINKLHVCEVN